MREADGAEVYVNSFLLDIIRYDVFYTGIRFDTPWQKTVYPEAAERRNLFLL